MATRKLARCLGVAVAACATAAAAAAPAKAGTGPVLNMSFDASAGTYAVSLDGTVWLQSPAAGAHACVAGKTVPLAMGAPQPASGADAFGAWAGASVPWTAAGSATPVVVTTFQQYASNPALVVVATQVPAGLSTAGCGGGTATPSLTFPAFDTSAGQAPRLGFVSWAKEAVKTTLAVTGLAALPRGALDDGPVIATAAGGSSLVWSSLDHHKIVVQSTQAGVYAVGPSAAIPALPAGWTYRVVLRAAYGGATAAAYAWGADLRAYYNTTRLPSVSLDKIGYYTDDGA
jgi:hypothetical protein